MDHEAVSPERTLDDCASGRLNGYTFVCGVVGQGMFYAACLNRIATVTATNKGTRVPQDWEPCRSACKTRTCQAQKMREEELAQGRPLYFQERGALSALVEKTRNWITDFTRPRKKPTAAAPAPAKPTSMLDAMTAAASITYADAISTPASATRSPGPGPIASAPRPTLSLKALPGETPLQMARRLAAARSKA